MPLRVDAERNRKALLGAAGALFDRTTDPASVTMDDVVRSACVGKGTLFRHYENKTELLQAVVADRLDALKTEISSGASSLGPAAPPRERLLAILLAIVAFKVKNLSISHALEATGRSAARSPFLESQPYRWAHALLVEIIANIDDTDPSFHAHLLLGLTRTDLIRYLVFHEHCSISALEIHIRHYIECLFGDRHSDRKNGLT